MTTTDTAATDAEDDAADQSDVDFKKSGLIAVTLSDGTRYRIRAPFFGELKTLRLAFEDLNEFIWQTVTRQQATAEALDLELAETLKSGDYATKPEARSELSLEYRARGITAGRQVADSIEERRTGWWRQVWEVLCVDGPLPAEDDSLLPAWMADADAPMAWLEHWRHTPVGPGKRRG